MPNIINDILNYIRRNGGRFRDWYVGIASNPKARLFTDHNVRQHRGLWIHSADLGSEAAARKVEQYLLSLGCRGGPGGGDWGSRYVYAYKVTPLTRE